MAVPWHQLIDSIRPVSWGENLPDGMKDGQGVLKKEEVEEEKEETEEGGRACCYSPAINFELQCSYFLLACFFIIISTFFWQCAHLVKNKDVCGK